ncbi:hypothetical protein CDV55_103869 [Aspergillus turcosus]|nr:hypothetical protein CDV55_103869 [Aspergillus turcosus]
MDVPLVSQLCSLLGNQHFPSQLASILSNHKANQSHESKDHLVLRIEASICTKDASAQARSSPPDSILLDEEPLTPKSIQNEEAHPPKRHKTVSGLRPSRHLEPAGTTVESPEPDHSDDTPPIEDQDTVSASVRQVHSDTGFPQRRKAGQDNAAPVLEPTSTDKLIAGIWRQMYSPVKLSRTPSVVEPTINIRTGVSGEVFRAVNTLCMKYYNQSQSSRALEMIVQAYWIECYEARIAVIRLENPHLSGTEARMTALKEACAVLNWKEKDLRNRMAIWRGYKEIKDAGGWPSLIFASSGVYRFCKYRTGFGEGFSTRLRHIRSSLEVAADTLHPEWRDLLHVIGQGGTRRQYHGHPHEWVTVTGEAALPLHATYAHLNLPNGFQYRFIDECVLDTTVFGEDPRRVPDLDPDICQVCKSKQADDVEQNQCSCFPTLFGGVKGPAPVQIFSTASGKNNGVVARVNFDRGAAIGEFVGLITNGISGVDVMVGGTKGRTYQIYQGEMGNFTRFINHSCRPNSQFQRFYWRGQERIISAITAIIMMETQTTTPALASSRQSGRGSESSSSVDVIAQEKQKVAAAAAAAAAAGAATSTASKDRPDLHNSASPKRWKTFWTAFRYLQHLTPKQVDDFMASYVIYNLDWSDEKQMIETLGPNYQEKVGDCLKAYYGVLNHLCALGDVEKMYIPPFMSKKATVLENQLLYEESIARDIGLGPGDKVLDLGCGRGRVAAHMTQFSGGAQVTGINIDPNQIAQAQKFNDKRGFQNKFVVQDFNSLPLPFEDETFDAFYQIQALSLCKDLTALFREIYRVVKPGAKISLLDWVSLPAYDPSNPEHAELMRRVKPLIGAVGTPTPEILERALADAGFTVLRSDNASLDGLQAPLIDTVDFYFRSMRQVILGLVKVHALPHHFKTLINRLCLDGQAFVKMDRMRLCSTSYRIIAQKPLR